MFIMWPIFLPAKITFGILAGLLIAATIIAQRYYRKGGRVFALGVGIAIVAFVPCCTVIQTITDPYQLGVFEYPDFQSVKGRFVQIFLPDSATHITIDKQQTLYRAKFSIGKQALDDWFDRHWEERGKYSKTPRASSAAPKEADSEEWFKEKFGNLGWQAPIDPIVYEGPRSPSYAGFTLLYSEPEGIAYQLANYW